MNADNEQPTLEQEAPLPTGEAMKETEPMEEAIENPDEIPMESEIDPAEMDPPPPFDQEQETAPEAEALAAAVETEASLSPFESITLNMVMQKFPKLLPKDLSAQCLHCPNAVWLLQLKDLKCWCTVMNTMTYQTIRPVFVIACDGILLGQGEDE